MEWIEANPLPEECRNCREEDCYNCDTAGKRWYLSPEEELRLRRKSLKKAIERLQREQQAGVITGSCDGITDCALSAQREKVPLGCHASGNTGSQ